MPKGVWDKDSAHKEAWKKGKEAASKSYDSKKDSEAFYGTATKVAKASLKKAGISASVGFDAFVNRQILSEEGLSYTTTITVDQLDVPLFKDFVRESGVSQDSYYEHDWHDWVEFSFTQKDWEKVRSFLSRFKSACKYPDQVVIEDFSVNSSALKDSLKRVVKGVTTPEMQAVGRDLGIPELVDRIGVKKKAGYSGVTSGAKSAMEIEIPGTNLAIRGFGRDINGNSTVQVGTPNERSRSIQLVSLNGGNSSIKSMDDLTTASDADRQKFFGLVKDYVAKYMKGVRMNDYEKKSVPQFQVIDVSSKEPVVSASTVDAHGNMSPIDIDALAESILSKPNHPVPLGAYKVYVQQHLVFESENDIILEEEFFSDEQLKDLIESFVEKHKA